MGNKCVYTDLYFIINNNLYITEYRDDIFSTLRSQNLLKTCNEVMVFITDTSFEKCKEIIWIAVYCFSVLGKTVNLICPDWNVVETFDTMKIDRHCYEIYSNIPIHLRDDVTCVSFQIQTAKKYKRFGYMITTKPKSFYFGEKYDDVPDEIFTFFDKGILDSINISNPAPNLTSFEQ